MQRRLRHFDKTGAHDRVDRNVVVLVRFADDLVMDLGTRRHVDDNIGLEPRLATESPVFAKAASFIESSFGLAPRRDVSRRRIDAVLGEVPLSDFHLATTAECTSTTDRIDIDTKTAGRVQQGRALRKSPAFARRHENDHRFLVVSHDDDRGADAGPRLPLSDRGNSRSSSRTPDHYP